MNHACSSAPWQVKNTVFVGLSTSIACLYTYIHTYNICMDVCI